MTPLPHSRMLHTPTQAMQLSKSHSSLVTINKQEDKVQSNSAHSTPAKSTNTEIRPFSGNARLTTRKLSESPSYADYENYFYI